MLITPPGTSEVASTSASDTAGSGAGPLAIATTVFPETIAGATRLTSPSSGASAGATTPTTPVGSGIVKLKYGPATGLAPPATWWILSAQPAYQTHRSIATLTSRAGSCAPVSRSSDSSCPLRPSMISATRYRTWPRLYAVRPAQPVTAPRAATIASRRSFREARAACASSRPSPDQTS
jgi:hypothetical protein